MECSAMRENRAPRNSGPERRRLRRQCAAATAWSPSHSDRRWRSAGLLRPAELTATSISCRGGKEAANSSLGGVAIHEIVSGSGVHRAGGPRRRQGCVQGIHGHAIACIHACPANLRTCTGWPLGTNRSSPDRCWRSASVTCNRIPTAVIDRNKSEMSGDDGLRRTAPARQAHVRHRRPRDRSTIPPPHLRPPSPPMISA